MIGTTISHYRILGQIGEGGMGVVYVAEDTRLGRRVAVKIPHAGKDESHYRSRFLREARAVSALNHPNIAAVFDYGKTEGGAPFIVMELVTGQTLGDLLMDQGLTLARAVEIIEQVAEALAEAHRCGIVHRDVKPSNVIINDRGQVKVLDFGLAKQLHSEGGNGHHVASLLATRTRSDVVIGTPLYLSPEQARGVAVDGRSDLFALGALLYECIAGRPAFSGSNVIEIGAQVLHFDPPPPSQFNPRVPAELDRVTLKALAKPPDERYQTAAEMAADLARVRARLSATDTARTRRLTTDAHLFTRASALNTLAAGLRRPRISPLGLLAVLAFIAAAAAAAYYLTRPTAYKPTPEAARLYDLGVEAMREGAHFKASGLFERAAQADASFALAHARLGEALAEMGYTERATSEALRAERLAPDERALEELDVLYRDAVSAAANRDYAEAVRVYQRIAGLAPDAPHVYVDLGRAHEKNNETQKAVENYTEATRRDPRYAAAYLRLGTLQARLNNSVGMTDALNRAAQLYGANAEGQSEIHYQRGRFYVQTNQKAEARRELERALELVNGTGNVYQQVQALLQLSYTEPGLERAREVASHAHNLAQTNGLHDQVALSLVTLGAHYLSHNQYDQAESYLLRALDYARFHKIKRLEAHALANLGSLRSKQNKPDEALRYHEDARKFYEEGGFRREAEQMAMLIGRARRQKGDYAGALNIFNEILARAEQASDPAQIAAARRECGTVLYFHERHPEARAHFDEVYRIFKSLNQPIQVAYTQLNRANVLWRMGLFDEARAALAEASQIASAGASPNRDVLTAVTLTEAQAALSRRQFAEAAAKAREVIPAAQALGQQGKHHLAEAHFTLGLAEVLSGARGLALCEESLRLAAEVEDPWFTPNSRLALAEALLAEGSARRALEEAHAARVAFTGLGRAESEWRALAVAARAAGAVGNQAEARDLLARASVQLSALEQSWGSAAAPYLARPDVQQLRKGLGGDAAAAAR